VIPAILAGVFGGITLTLVAILALAFSRMTGFRVEIGGVRFVDRDANVKDELATLRSDYVSVLSERDAARAGMDQLEAALREAKGHG
jgi:hypothetical protein